MSQPVNLSNDVYNRLNFFKARRKHKSFSNAIEELLNAFWSPQQQIIQVEEEIQRIQSWYKSRNLYDGNVETDLEKLRAHSLWALKQQKAKNIKDLEQVI